MPAQPENVIHQLVVGDEAAIARIVQQAQTSNDVTTVVAAAFFAPAGSDLMARAATIPVEGVNVAMNDVSGYPAITTTQEARALADASGLTAADYTLYTEGGTANNTRPQVAAGAIALVPNSIAGTRTAVDCFVMYTAATGRDTAPVYTVGAAGRTAAERVQDCE